MSAFEEKNRDILDRIFEYPFEQNRASDWLESLNRSALHAYLLTGHESNELALRAAAQLLCTDSDGANKPCGECNACRLFRKAGHPDFLHINKLDKEKDIKISSIRELSGQINISSHFGRFVVWIEDAHKMNKNAQNALLRTLEEPPNNVHFFLTGSEEGLLSTIRSRCSIFRLSDNNSNVDLDPESLLPSKQIIELWEKKQFSQSAIIYAENKSAISKILNAQTHLIRDIIANKYGLPLMQNFEYEWINTHSKKWDAKALSKMLKTVIEANFRLNMNLNSLLVIDWLTMQLLDF